jgi:tetratricopeptide (TPR) repeat protein
MLLSLLLRAALATGVTHTEVPCPLDGTPVRQFRKVSGNTSGGYDSDLARYSTRGQFRTHAISTCPVDFLSLYGTDLNMDIPAPQQAQVLAVIQHARNQLTAPDDPEVWERYGIAAAVYRVLGHHPMALAQLYLEASWTARDVAVGVYIGGLDGPKAAAAILNAGAVELNKELTVPNRKTVLHNLARVAHRAGLSAQRDTFLRAYQDAGPMDDAEKRAIERFEQMAKQVEPTQQRLAITEFKAALNSDNITPKDVAKAHYLIADLSRRLGKLKEALSHYRQVLTVDEADPHLTEMARFFVAKLAE